MSDSSVHQGQDPVTIRMATAADALLLAGFRYRFRSRLDTAQECEEEFVRRCHLWMEERLEQGGVWKCWIAEQGRAAVGNLWMQIIEKIPNPTDEPEKHAYVTNFFVLEEVRGQGVGSRLLSAALAWAKEQGAHAVILWPTEQSRSLYLRYGFKVPEDLLELLIPAAEEQAGH